MDHKQQVIKIREKTFDFIKDIRFKIELDLWDRVSLELLTEIHDAVLDLVDDEIDSRFWSHLEYDSVQDDVYNLIQYQASKQLHTYRETGDHAWEGFFNPVDGLLNQIAEVIEDEEIPLRS